MEAAIHQFVWRRAGSRCEYYQMLQESDETPFEIDHIISRKHRGQTIASNLASSCFECNSSKGSNIAGRDRVTRKLAPLFHPRRHKWDRHFRWDGPWLVGRTAIGRVTVDVLNINDPLRVDLRRELMNEGEFS